MKKKRVLIIPRNDAISMDELKSGCGDGRQQLYGVSCQMDSSCGTNCSKWQLLPCQQDFPIFIRKVKF